MRMKLFLVSTLTFGLTIAQSHVVAAEYTVRPVEIPELYELDGTVEAVDAGTISAQTSGVVLSIHGDVGDTVSTGDVLINIDSTQQKAAVAQAEAALAQARALNEDAQTALQRNARLQKQGTLSKGDYDRSVAEAKSAAANVEAAKAALTQAEAQLSYTVVKAPYAGVIMERFTEVGELVTPGTPLMSGYGSGKMRAVTDVPQRVARQYESADQVAVRIADVTSPAASVTLYPFADPSRHSVRMRARLDESIAGDVAPGQWLKVIIETGKRSAIAVPQSAVLRRGELNAVYVHENDRSLLRQVRLGKSFTKDGELWYEVLAGLSTGNVVYDNALDQLAIKAQEPASKNNAEGE